MRQLVKRVPLVFWRVLRRHIVHLTAVATFLILHTIYAYLTFTSPATKQQNYTINNTGCRIPLLDPYDWDVLEFDLDPFTYIKPCRDSNITLLQSNDTYIWINQSYVNGENVSVSCCYRPFHRHSFILNVTSAKADSRALFHYCINFNNSIRATDEFVRIECTIGKRDYVEYFVFAPKKNLTVFKTLVKMPKTLPGYNVIVLDLGSISRMTFYRKMPITLSYLKSRGAVELLGYNKVGDDTFANVVPLLLGKSVWELRRICWIHMRMHFDNCPFIWNSYKYLGYYTAFAEDNSQFAVFNNYKHGFLTTPTDYYPYTFIKVAEETIGNNRCWKTNLCMGNKFFYEIFLNYIEQLVETLKTSKFFGYFREISVSYGHAAFPKIMDIKYKKLIRTLYSSIYMNNTVLIVCSNHGAQWGDIRYTKQGRLEERLPIAYLLMPKSFQEKYPLAYKNLQSNRYRLTTPFDMHSTLSDLANLTTIEDKNIKNRTETSLNDRAISLFLPIPENRTCKAAGIENHFCACELGKNTALNSRIVIKGAEHIIDYINVLIHGYYECAPLWLGGIQSAMELGSTREWREFHIVITTEPGKGEYEATLRLNHASQWSLIGRIKRSNPYSKRIQECGVPRDYKPFCYCWYKTS